MWLSKSEDTTLHAIFSDHELVIYLNGLFLIQVLKPLGYFHIQTTSMVNTISFFFPLTVNNRQVWIEILKQKFYGTMDSKRWQTKKVSTTFLQ